MVTQHLDAHVGGSEANGFVRPKVRILPDGRMPASDAAIYLDRATPTLAGWRCNKVGPDYVTINGRVYYYKAALDRFIAENQGLNLKHLSEKAAERRRRRKAERTGSTTPNS